MDLISSLTPVPSVMNKGIIKSFTDKLFSEVMSFEKWLDRILLSLVLGKDGELFEIFIIPDIISVFKSRRQNAPTYVQESYFEKYFS